MERLAIEPTDATLLVDFDPETAILMLRGESYPENANKFFTPVLEWLDDYFSSLDAGEKVTVDMDILYFNSSSSKALMNLFDAFDTAARQGLKLQILWRYHVENEIAQECGEEFGEDLDTARLTLCPYEDKS